jgi:hypothetical protein
VPVQEFGRLLTGGREGGRGGDNFSREERHSMAPNVLLVEFDDLWGKGRRSPCIPQNVVTFDEFDGEPLTQIV